MPWPRTDVAFRFEELSSDDTEATVTYETDDTLELSEAGKEEGEAESATIVGRKRKLDAEVCSNQTSCS